MNNKNDDKEQLEISALRKNEERYRVLFDTLIEGFCTIEVIFDANDKVYLSSVIESVFYGVRQQPQTFLIVPCPAGIHGTFTLYTNV